MTHARPGGSRRSRARTEMSATGRPCVSIWNELDLPVARGGLRDALRAKPHDIRKGWSDWFPEKLVYSTPDLNERWKV